MIKRLLIFWAVLFVAVRLVSIALAPLTDTSEARYSELAKVMATEGDWFAPQVWIDGELVPFMGKPPLGFWLMAISEKAFGFNGFAARLPAALSGLTLLLLMFLVLREYSNEHVAWTAVLTSATCASFFVLSGAALVDGILSLFSMGAIFLYYAFLKEKAPRRRKLWSALVFVFLGMAFITKGPVGLVYFGLPVFCWTLLGGHWSALRNHTWLAGGGLFLLTTVPCFLMLEQAMPGFLNYFFIHENFLRFTTTHYGDLYSSATHHWPLGLAIPLTLAATLPWMLVPLFDLAVEVRRRWNDLRVPDANTETERPDFATSIPKRWLDALRSYARCPESLFPIGLISLTLFWSCSSHIMFYYLPVMAPLFGAWLGFHFERKGVSLRKTTVAATALTILYLIAYVPVSYILDSDKSTRAILGELKNLPNITADTPVRFVRRVPYSAYFYAGGNLIPHAEESVAQSVLKGLENSDTVFVLRSKYLKRIPPALRKRLKVRAEKGEWLIAAIKRNENEKQIAAYQR